MSENQSVYTYLDTIVGSIMVVQDEIGVKAIGFMVGTEPHRPDSDWYYEKNLTSEAVRQLRAYFSGDLRKFKLPLSLKGTPFQQTVWKALQEIPYGETITYGDIAKVIGCPKAVRAVGGANGKNPIPIIVPCHRVIGSTGHLTGFGGELPIKRALLDHEWRCSGGTSATSWR